ncbi:molybdate ABC transporter substrate-binding protein [Conexibacter woesei]|uniref:Molybdenum ABC transporter, periplasmic molybdate-binding protein n=1 Tax=Conexibacter woesei (strain DSM 14684 / CCUG 47730 / CIP 108061 / JCM 11494 / NBRC 100937 / ID131577) TaxID=469383 RepID=D3EZB7_CONWI|nr:molybdate ABC transporter substrate-binding protein [Conexibacter woesei]ADB51882.1 molybdenum ABC transporter, periplasmic molybdate-binding protein [Conexibacter woesei DSM 14684]
MKRLRLLLVAIALAAALAGAGCGSDDDGGSGSGSGATAAGDADGDLVVSGATSLKQAFEQYGEQLGGDVRFQFAGSDELAAQIRQGVRPDVFASANTTLPDELHSEGLVGEPVVFAANRLVIAVPSDGARVRSVADLARSGVTIAIGSESVPIGAYTRRVLARLGSEQSDAILANVRSNEPDVGGVVGKVSQGAVDAGFVYVTDVDGASGKLNAIELPQRIQPSVAYAAAVVDGAEHPAAARRFVDGLLSGEGAAALRAAGFEPPPTG